MDNKNISEKDDESSFRSHQERDSVSEIKVPTIDDFEIIKPISKGAFGKVFLGCKKGRPEKVYAIKVMKKSEMIHKNMKHQVITERDAMAKSISPFVVQLYYSIQTQNNIYLVMEYLIGGDLKSLLTVCGYFDEPMAVMYIAEVTLALEYLHNKGIIHRDLKPDNMLLTAEGHIKLTDFGLSKFSMSFNSKDVPMTPKTPLPYSYKYSDNYRTPGQILSLRSNLAFSTGKFASPYNMTPDVTRSSQFTDRPANSTGSHQGEDTETSDGQLHNLNATHYTPKPRSGKVFTKQKSIRDTLLTKSTSMYIPEPAGMTAAEKMTPSFCSSTNPPVKRLMSTMQDSLNWTESTDAHITTDRSSINISDLSSVAKVSGPDSISLSCLDSPDFANRDSVMSVGTGTHRDSDMSSPNGDFSDDVFVETGTSVDISDRMDVSLTECLTDTGTDPGTDCNVQCHCSQSADNINKCECRSHLKAPSRQEKITDDTPQMHRTEESVWNSYAAKNLRSLRLGSYLEENDDSDISSNKENIGNIFTDRCTPRSPETRQSAENFRKKCEIRAKAKPRRLMKTKSFCYPSDEESDYELNRYRDRNALAKKRSFCHVEQSPVRRTHSADSGLTQEFRLLRFKDGEPHSKRSHSIPRTRIRFHSGNCSKAVNKSELAVPDSKSQNTECLSKMMDEVKNLSDSDRLTSLSADESRLVEGHSDTSTPEAERSHSITTSDIPTTAETGVTTTNTESKFCFNDVAANEPLIGGSRNIFPLCNKRLAHLKKPMVSSVGSETEIDDRSPKLSSVHESDGQEVSCMSLDQDSSVFDGREKLSASKTNACNPSQSELCKEPMTPPLEPLLPPPPPRSRKKSGRQLPAILKINTGPHLPEARKRHSSGSGSTPRTPKTPLRQKVGFLTPNVKCPPTPRTPLDLICSRSKSFSHAVKTPYRTPKSVRRGPANDPEEERILGTPDYLAPEILQQKPHSPAVDWWALGICMFEFLTGVPPFNDQTPELVFENILSRDILWPDGEEALSAESQEAIDQLLTIDPGERPRGHKVRKMTVFQNIDWHNLLEVKPIFVPEPADLTDTTYFEARNDLLNLFVSDVDI